jgi:hypothetical protein
VRLAKHFGNLMAECRCHDDSCECGDSNRDQAYTYQCMGFSFVFWQRDGKFEAQRRDRRNGRDECSSDGEQADVGRGVEPGDDRRRRECRSLPDDCARCDRE